MSLFLQPLILVYELLLWSAWILWRSPMSPTDAIERARDSLVFIRLFS